MKHIEIISTSLRSIEGTKSKATYLGKKVFAKSGTYAGRVQDIILRNDSFGGIIIHGKHPMFIDKEYISSDSGTAIMLSIDPIIMNIGKHVFDSEGRAIGKCIGIQRKTNANTLSAIVVKKNLFTKPFIIPHGDISVSKTNIITKSAYQQ